MSVEKRRIKKMIQKFLMPSARYVIVHLNKHRMLIDLNDRWMKDNFLFQDMYEPQTTNYIKEHVQKDDVVIDVGAHIGYHAMNFWKAGASVLAFEASQDMLQLLRHNTKHTGIQIFGNAVSNVSGIVTFYKSPRSAWSSLFPQRSCTILKVPCIQIDDLQLEKLDWVKIDVEGAEFLVLDGMKETLQRCSPKLFIEWLPRSKTDFSAILELLDGWRSQPMDHNMLFWRTEEP